MKLSPQVALALERLFFFRDALDRPVDQKRDRPLIFLPGLELVEDHPPRDFPIGQLLPFLMAERDRLFTSADLARCVPVHRAGN